jgi:hypothetical protein
MDMKNILFIFVLIIFLTSCDNNYIIVEKEVKCIVDSVDYHQIGEDNTLQTTPYWKLYFRGEKIGVTSYRRYKIGDTIKIITKKIIKKTYDK